MDPGTAREKSGMTTNTPSRIAAVLVAAEGVGLIVLAVWQLIALAGGDTDSATSAIALVVLTAIGAVAVLAFAFAVWRGLSWGRSGGIVTQALVLAVALGAATGAYAHPLVGLALALPAVAALAALVVSARGSGRERDAEASDEPPAKAGR